MVRGFERSLSDPRGAQEARLRAMLSNARATRFAEEHALDGWETLASFRERVPVRAHADLVPWLDQVAAGGRSVLARGEVRQLVETSGTTGSPKRLPVNAPWIQSCNAAQRLWMLGLLRDDEQLAGGKALSIVSPAEHARSPGGIPIGSNTGRIFLDQPWWIRWRAAVPYAVCGIREPSIRAYTLLRHALGKDIRSWTTANPSTILTYARHMAAWWEDLRQDARDGTLRRGPAADLSPVDRLRLARGLGRVRLGDDPRPAMVWPLRRINCWTGGSAGFFLARLPEALGRDVPVREVGIHASEGVFGVSVDDGDPVAWLGGHLLEFRGKDGGLRFAWEVTTGEEYELVVTTEAGLWRYDLGDVVRVTGWLGQAPRLVFVRKAGSFLNATGEKVTESHLLSAARLVFPAATGVCAATEWCDPPRIALWVEGPLAVDDVARFDRALCAENLEYASKRETGRLAPPTVLPLSPGALANRRAGRIAAGAPEAQVKDPVIVTWEEGKQLGAPR